MYIYCKTVNIYIYIYICIYLFIYIYIYNWPRTWPHIVAKADWFRREIRRMRQAQKMIPSGPVSVSFSTSQFLIQKSEWRFERWVLGALVLFKQTQRRKNCINHHKPSVGHEPYPHFPSSAWEHRNWNLGTIILPRIPGIRETKIPWSASLPMFSPGWPFGILNHN